MRAIDLDAGVVAHLELDKSQPMLSRDEEALAVSIAMIDERVRSKLAMGDCRRRCSTTGVATTTDVAYARRSAAVTFGRSDGHASLIAVVDLVDQAGDAGRPRGAMVMSNVIEKRTGSSTGGSPSRPGS